MARMLPLLLVAGQLLTTSALTQAIEDLPAEQEFVAMEANSDSDWVDVLKQSAYDTDNKEEVVGNGPEQHMKDAAPGELNKYLNVYQDDYKQACTNHRADLWMHAKFSADEMAGVGEIVPFAGANDLQTVLHVLKVLHGNWELTWDEVAKELMRVCPKGLAGVDDPWTFPFSPLLQCVARSDYGDGIYWTGIVTRPQRSNPGSDSVGKVEFAGKQPIRKTASVLLFLRERQSGTPDCPDDESQPCRLNKCVRYYWGAERVVPGGMVALTTFIAPKRVWFFDDLIKKKGNTCKAADDIVKNSLPSMYQIDIDKESGFSSVLEALQYLGVMAGSSRGKLWAAIVDNWQQGECGNAAGDGMSFGNQGEQNVFHAVEVLAQCVVQLSAMGGNVLNMVVINKDEDLGSELPKDLVIPYTRKSFGNGDLTGDVSLAVVITKDCTQWYPLVQYDTVSKESRCDNARDALNLEYRWHNLMPLAEFSNVTQAFTYITDVHPKVNEKKVAYAKIAKGCTTGKISNIPSLERYIECIMKKPEMKGIELVMRMRHTMSSVSAFVVKTFRGDPCDGCKEWEYYPVRLVVVKARGQGSTTDDDGGNGCTMFAIVVDKDEKFDFLVDQPVTEDQTMFTIFDVYDKVLAMDNQKDIDVAPDNAGEEAAEEEEE